MNTKLRISLQIFCINAVGLGMSVCSDAASWPVHVEFQHLTVEDGLPSNTINSVIRDHQGFLWIATENGVSRYDGYTFTNFRSQKKDTVSISSNIAYVVFEDDRQRLWVGSEKGLDLFNGSRHYFDEHFLQDIPVRSIYQDRMGNLWIGSDWGLYLFNEKSRTFYRPFANLFKDGQVTYNTITSMAEDKEGNLWIGTANEGIYACNIVKKTFVRFVHDGKTPGSLSHNDVRRIMKDRQGNMWVATYGGGLNLYLPETNTFRKFTHRHSDRHSIASDLVMELWQDAAGRLWIGTDGNGLDIFDMEKISFHHVVHASDDQKTLSNNVVRCIGSDGRGGVWIGTYAGGVNFFNQNVEPFFYYSLPTFNGNSSVTSFAEDKQGNLWIGTDGGGLCHFNKATGRFTNFQYDEKNDNSLSDNRVLSLLIDHNGMLWIGTYLGGLCRYDPGAKQFVRYCSKDGSGLSDNIVWTLLEDSRHRIWVGTNNGLDIFDRKKNTFSCISTANSNLTNDMIRSLLEDSRGRLWVGTQNGLNVMGADRHHFSTMRNDMNDEHSLSNNWIRTICEDRQGNIWVGTFEGGLNAFDEKTGSFLVITEAGGLPDNVISSILSDTANNLWVATGRGLARISAGAHTIHRYAANEGVQDNQFNINAGYRTRTGEFLFGSMNGFTRFTPAAIGLSGSNRFPPPVVFTDFKIFNRTVVPGEADAPLTRHINETREVVLSYDQYVLTFEFSALNFVHPENNRYAYRLLGFEEDWNYVGGKRSATYTNLKPGKYRLQVKASNNTGVWNQEGTSLALVIMPPFWETWWFYTILTALFVSVALFIFNTVRKRIREKLRVSRVISELQIKALITQMNPHFIFNCLTSIQELVMKNRQPQAIHYLAQFSRLLRIILQSSDRNYTLLADELALLESYLELESLRFEEKFHYHISVDGAIDPEEISIPCFLIQPFVENGLWHGLMHKEGDRNMIISFVTEGDHVLVCRIDDNGVGREQAAKLRKNIKAHRSLGIKITNARIKLMREQGDAVGLQIIDKMNGNGCPGGTTVVVKLPINTQLPTD